MNATVKDIMTTQVVAVRRGATFKEMAAALRRYRVSALPVVDDDGKVIGVVSEADMLAKEALADPRHDRPAAAPQGVRKAAGLTAGDLMTHPAVTVRPGRLGRARRPADVHPPGQAAPGGRRAAAASSGSISRTDLLAVYDRPDEEIRAEIVDT